MAARTFGTLAGALTGFIVAVVICIGLGLFTQPEPPPWIGTAMDITILAFVIPSAWAGWFVTRECALYELSLPCLVLGAGILFYFGYDEAPGPGLFLPAPTTQQLADYDILLWLSKEGTPQSRAGELSALVQDDLFKTLPTTPEELRAYVTHHAVQIRTAWESDALGREWLERIASMGTIAESSLAPEAPILGVQPVRKVINLRISYALLLAEEGDIAGAYGTLAPVIHFGQSLGAARTLVHSMIGTVVLKQGYRALRMLEPGLPPKQRIEATALLRSSTPIGDRIYTVFAGELGFARGALSNSALFGNHGIDSQILRRLQVGNLVIHRERSLNELAALYGDIIPALSARDLEKADSYAKAFITGPFPWRNFGGTLTLRMMIPAFGKTSDTMWQVEDQRLSLLAELE